MRKESSCANTWAILEYAVSQEGLDPRSLYAGLSAEIDRLADPESHLRTPTNWVDAEFVAGMLARVRQQTGKELVAFDIGRFAVERALVNKRQRLVLKLFGSHSKALVYAQRLNDRWNRNKRIELIHLGRHSAIVRLHWHPIPTLTRDLCLHSQGVITHLPNFWDAQPLVLEEARCHFTGAPYCEYHLRWRPSGRLGRLFKSLKESPGLRREIIRQMEADRRRMDTQYEEMLRLNREMGWKLKQIGLMQQCSRAVLSVLDEGALLDKIAEFLETTCQVQHFALFRVNEDRTELRGLKGRAFLAWDREQIAHLRMALDDSSVLCRAVRSGVGETEGHLGGATGDEPGWVHAVPLIARGEVAGVLAVWGRETGRRQADILEMLHLFAPLLAVTLENAMIHSQMRTQLRQLKESRSLLCRADKLSAMGSLASQLAHEIKNPLTAIETFFQLLPERWSDSDFRTRFFDIAKNESMRIRRLLKQFLNLAAQGEEVVGTANLHAVIEYLLVILEPHASQRQVRLELQAQARRTEFRMVADKLQQAFMNILMNALSAAPAGSAVVVATSDAVSGGVRPAVRIDILDRGPGIPAEWRQRIFEPFFSRQPPEEKNEGTGLGLFIAKQNIADHGGEIEVLDREGGGTLFRVLIPVERRQG